MRVPSLENDRQKGGRICFFLCQREKQLYLLTSLQIINSLFTGNLGLLYVPFLRCDTEW